MTDWIHCNHCYIQPSPTIKFFLTSCGHVFCASCAEKCTKPSCYVCENSCNVIPLSSKMEQSVEVYFRHPVDIVKRHSQELQKVLEFQSAHRKRLLNKTKEKLERAKALYNDFEKARKYIQGLERKMKLRDQEMEFLKHSTPGRQFPVASDQSHSRTPLKNLTNQQVPITSRPSSAQPTTSRFHSPAPNTMARNSYPHPPPPPAGRLIARTPPSGGKMGTIPGSGVSTPSGIQTFYTPQSTSITPNRVVTPSSQESLSWLTTGVQSISLPNRVQSKLPGSGRSRNASGSSSEGNIRTATVSPYSGQNTPT